MKLYYNPLSSNARKATMAVELLGAQVDRVLVNLAAGDQRKPDYLALNPNGKVPTLVDGKLLLWESGAIMIYLAEKTPGQTVYPSDPAARADVNRWLFWSAAQWTPQIGVLNMENMLKPMFGWGPTDEAKVAAASAELTKLGAVLDAHLASRKFLCGDAVTLADVSVACPLMTMHPAKLPLGQLEHLGAWFTRVQALEAWQKTQPPGR